MVGIQDAIVWARALVRACEDADLSREYPGQEAYKVLAEVEYLAKEPSGFAVSWLRCSVPTLLGLAEQATRLGRPVRARAYQACIAVRLLAAEAGEASLRRS